MDEMNADGCIGSEPAGPIQSAATPTDRPRGLITNEPMLDWPFPPPIFGPR
jgi:hypothetical protein